MSDENQEVKAPEVKQEEVKNEPSEIEIKARNAGWVPKEEFADDPDKWVDADEFVRRGPLFEKINAQSREMKRMREAMEALQLHHAKVKETSYKEALAVLKAQKREAFTEGDPDKILAIEEKMDDLKEQQRSFEAQRAREVAAPSQELHPEFKAFLDRNPWYQAEAPMKAFADTVGVELRNSGMSPTEVLKKVEQKVREEFPHKFRNANRDKAPAVEGAGKGTGKAGSNAPAYQLTDEERRVMNTFVRQKIMTEAEYIAELKKIKESQ